MPGPSGRHAQGAATGSIDCNSWDGDDLGAKGAVVDGVVFAERDADGHRPVPIVLTGQAVAPFGPPLYGLFRLACRAWVSLFLVAACGSADSGSGEASPSTTEVFRSVALQVPSEIVDGLLVVDYSSLDETRSMMATLAPVGVGEPVGMFVTANDDGAIGRFFPYSDGGTEVAVPTGELSGATDAFDLEGVATGSYEPCSELVGGSMLACTTFMTP